ncbi:MAG: VWA domain-containing protein [Bacteroidetes bacterium]|nr:VWA domain-containing protein [Bacteroidota bacterium]
MKTKLLISLLLIVSINFTYADGIMLSSKESYPNHLLKNVSTEINVEINGLVAITTVFQKFLNESDSITDAVWNFPLPEKARSMRMRYWYNDTAYDAKLMVIQQTTNPGTGEGGIAAEINNYIGKNGIRVHLKKIRPHDIQAVELTYIELLDYDNGNCSYTYPLETKDLVSFPIDYVKINIDLKSNRTVLHYDAKNFSSDLFELGNDSDKHLTLEVLKPKAYLSADFDFEFTIDNVSFDQYMYSSLTDSTMGYFNLFWVNQIFMEGYNYMNSKIVFLIGNSSTMSGYKLQQSLIAVKNALDMLSRNDSFNIILYNSTVDKWKDSLVVADSMNVLLAKTYLDNVKGHYGNWLDIGLQEALGQFNNASNSNTIFAFTDGKSALDPIKIKDINLFKTAIFIAAIGKDVDRYRLEMTSSLNYGFVRYFDEDDDIKKGLNSIFLSISHPVFKNTQMDFNKSDVIDVGPVPFPTAFVGTYFYAAGRYSIPDTATCKMTFEGIYGHVKYPFLLTYNGYNESNNFAKNLWAKQKMDDLERKIMIYGESEVWKQELIELSLAYKMKCRYTAYIATYEYDPGGPWLDIKESDEKPNMQTNSQIELYYPNPFSSYLNVNIYLSKHDFNKTKLLKIYNSAGILVHLVDLTLYPEGSFELHLLLDKYRNRLSLGYNVLILQIGNEVVSSAKILYVPNH